MFIAAFFSWWYTDGWKQVATTIDDRVRKVAADFSIAQLFKTLFAPWRRIITYPGASLEDKLRAWGDNLFSRTIGFIVRLFVILTFFMVVAVVFIFSLLEAIIWPLLPVAAVACLVIGAAW